MERSATASEIILTKKYNAQGSENSSEDLKNTHSKRSSLSAKTGGKVDLNIYIIENDYVHANYYV